VTESNNIPHSGSPTVNSHCNTDVFTEYRKCLSCSFLFVHDTTEKRIPMAIGTDENLNQSAEREMAHLGESIRSEIYSKDLVRW
jgi:hypothetical protein